MPKLLSLVLNDTVFFCLDKYYTYISMYYGQNYVGDQKSVKE